MPKETFGLPVTIGGVVLNNVTDFVIHVENQLGWTPNDTVPLYKARGIEVAKLKRKILTKPNLYTWHNLLITVEYCRRKQVRVTSPVALCWKVEQALKEIGPEAPTSPVAERIQKAIAWEQQHDLVNCSDWVAMLTRAAGAARESVLADWKQARFG